MENFVIVRTEHLNHYGRLFGGAMLRWVDESAWIAASRDYPGCSLVTLAMDRVEFHQSVPNGAILRFQVTRARQGTTSVTYAVEVLSDNPGATEEVHVFSTNVTFVYVDADGNKRPLPA